MEFYFHALSIIEFSHDHLFIQFPRQERQFPNNSNGLVLFSNVSIIPTFVSVMSKTVKPSWRFPCNMSQSNWLILLLLL